MSRRPGLDVMAAVGAVAVLAIAFALVLGFRDDDASSPLTVSAPPQQSAQIAALRTIPGNPPRFALLTLADDGSELRVLATAPARGLQRLHQLAWSPDAVRVYFIGVLGERRGEHYFYYESDLYVVASAGGVPNRLTTSKDVVAVVPSPDGQTLLIGRDDRPGTLPREVSLWLLDADGRNERRFVAADAREANLPGSWSPDRSSVAFTRCRGAPLDEFGLMEPECAVYAISPDGSRLRRLAERGGQPAFSPDGRQIAFVSDRDRHGTHAVGSDESAFSNELYVMAADGENQRRLTRTESLDEASPAWSPDGSRIAYVRTGPARFQKQLMVVDADGSCPTRLAGNGAATRVGTPWFQWPAWRPGRLTGDLAPLECP